MPNLIYNEGKRRLVGAMLGSVDLSALRVLLVKATYVANADQAALDDGTANDASSHELTVAGYARQVLANKTFGADLSADFAYLDADDVVFAALATGETIGGAIVFLHTGNDATAVPLLFFDLVDTPTNGSNITIQWAAIAAGGVMKAA
jgi:hypothetical protein